uniref:WW domain-containing protein n=1 Tax=Trichuris muris TaxID=70415 RepID=A0A5S6QVN1_TRIMR
MALYGEYPQGGASGDSQVPTVQHQRSRSNVVIRSNVDLDQALNDHFRKSIECLGSPSVARTGGHSLSVASSWRDKNLPDTFFKPSKQGSRSPVVHSRVGSDSSGCHTVSSPCSVLSACATGPPSRGNAAANANTAALGSNVQHTRAHSSPATLQNGQLTFASSYGVQPSATGPYGRDHNFEMDADEAPLPPGWEMGCAENGQPYFINHIEKTTTWEDPRKRVAKTDINLPPLPTGWEEKVTPQGERYFVNHNDETTSWFDPRIPQELQRPYVSQRDQRFVDDLPGGRATSECLEEVACRLQSAVCQQQQQPNLKSSSFCPSTEQRVQELIQERQQYRSRQQEILKQGLLGDCCNNAIETRFNTDSYPMNMVDNAEYHSRQKSCDSGVGMTLNSGCFLQPQTPENFLASDIELNISGIDLNSIMDVDPSIQDLNPQDMEQYLSGNMR